MFKLVGFDCRIKHAQSFQKPSMKECTLNLNVISDFKTIPLSDAFGSPGQVLLTNPRHPTSTALLQLTVTSAVRDLGLEGVAVGGATT